MRLLWPFLLAELCWREWFLPGSNLQLGEPRALCWHGQLLAVCSCCCCRRGPRQLPIGCCFIQAAHESILCLHALLHLVNQP